jgi:hypothetical protein
MKRLVKSRGTTLLEVGRGQSSRSIRRGGTIFSTWNAAMLTGVPFSMPSGHRRTFR